MKICRVVAGHTAPSAWATHVKATAEQFADAGPWATLLRYISERIAPSPGPFRPPKGLPATG